MDIPARSRSLKLDEETENKKLMRPVSCRSYSDWNIRSVPARVESTWQPRGQDRPSRLTIFISCFALFADLAEGSMPDLSTFLHEESTKRRFFYTLRNAEAAPRCLSAASDPRIKISALWSSAATGHAPRVLNPIHSRNAEICSNPISVPISKLIHQGWIPMAMAFNLNPSGAAVAESVRPSIPFDCLAL
ncbi:hypothetical protein Hypma_007302 [Hypsizygus marmoreus]|uniref:Uncharacterized protein n=1 Tax=Hypsizygus marmoreus TaxID=39966 RepID=A0A369K8L2_HYPMA|nr:hypothetical protein Hypma_007302 [Hypsizygus marmoreus]